MPRQNLGAVSTPCRTVRRVAGFPAQVEASSPTPSRKAKLNRAELPMRGL